MKTVNKYMIMIKRWFTKQIASLEIQNVPKDVTKYFKINSWKFTAF